jgi:GcrA cell cycle regulator
MSGTATWTPEQDAEIVALWRKGLSGAAVGREVGRSKNAVVGRLWRIKATERQVVRVRVPKPKPAPKPKRVVLQFPVREYNPHKYRNVGLLDARADQCREIVGHDGLAIFCGEIIVEGSSYCQHHHTINYLPARARKAAA